MEDYNKLLQYPDARVKKRKALYTGDTSLAERVVRLIAARNAHPEVMQALEHCM